MFWAGGRPSAPGGALGDGVACRGLLVPPQDQGQGQKFTVWTVPLDVNVARRVPPE